MIFGRAQYALFGIPCVLNLLGMFYVMFGAAFKPGAGAMVFVGGAMFFFVAALFGFAAGARARDLGWPVLGTGLGMVLLIGTGPAVLLPVLMLLFVPGKGSAPAVGVGGVVIPLLAFVAPWGVVWISSLLMRP
ncbi:MAG: hypothetical protein ACT4P9_13995 [Betaproteobacteria bacterium]